MDARVLVVEDEALIAESLRDRLQRMGHHMVGVVATGEEAVEIAFREKPELVLMDIRLRGRIDGIETVQRIQEKLDAAFIYLTAHADDATLIRAKRTQPSGYLLKPVEDRELQLAVDLALLKHQKEVKIAESEKRLARTLMSIGDSVIAVDANDKVTMMNPAAESLTEWRLSDALGAPAGHVFRVTDTVTRRAVEFADLRANMDRRNSISRGDLVLITQSGKEIPIESSLAEMQDEEHRALGFVLVFRDRTESLRAEAKAREVENRRNDSRRMEAIGRLAGGVAHDVNNCMTVIIGYGEILLGALPENCPERSMVDAMKKSGERAATMARQLLAFGRQQFLFPKDIDLNEFLTKELAVISQRMGNEIEIVKEFDSHAGIVRVDSGQLGQVVATLAANARDAMPATGRLTIATRRVHLSESDIAETPEVAAGDYAIISITDTGTGMDTETKLHLFEPFFTTKEVGKGTGMGLASAYGIIKQSGGHISFESELSRGTTFRIYLPRVTPEARKFPEVGPRPGPSSILLVEDNDMLRGMVRRVLVDQGYRVWEAADGAEALQLHGDDQTPIDLVLTDVVMPRMSGRVIAERLRQKRPTLKVLYMSSYPPEQLTRSNLMEGTGLFLLKPFSRDDLLAKVQLALAAN